MLEVLQTKIVDALTAEALKTTFGNRAPIESEKRAYFAEILGRLFPAIQNAVRDEIAVVTDQLVSAERECAMATEGAKMATGIVFKATETLLASLDAVHAAEARIVDSQNAIIRAEANLKAARAEFAKILERTKE